MFKCLENKYQLANILSYLSLNDILKFYRLNKSINGKLSKETNPIINSFFYENVTKTLYSSHFDEKLNKNNNKINRNDLFNTCWKSDEDWRLFLSKAKHDLLIFPDEEVKNRFCICFKFHLYLPDLRKKNDYLEYNHSTIHQEICYDKKFREACSHNYYSKFINEEYINNNSNESTIKILREGLYFEKQLKNYIETYQDLKNNEEYIQIISEANAYDFEKLKNYPIENNSRKNIIILFLTYISKNLINYCIYILETIRKVKNDRDKNIFLNEYTNQYNNYINSSLLINNHFRNVNLIISYFNRLHLKNNVEFSLYDLAINIFKKNVFNKLGSDLFIRTTILFKEISTKNIVNKVKNINNLNNEEDETNDNSYDEIDTEDESNEDNKDQKTFQKTVNCILDLNIDKENANAINHSAIKLDKIYNNLEINLIEEGKNVIKEKKDEIPLTQIFENLEFLLKSDKGRNSKNSRNSLRIINRTKKKMLVESFKILFPEICSKLSKDFNSHIKQNDDGSRNLVISDFEKINNCQYNCDLSDFYKKKRLKIEEKAQNDINDVKSYIYGQNINGYDLEETKRLIDEYMDNNGIECVLLAKKMYYFYNKECFYYDEKDRKIFNILTNKGKEEDKKIIFDQPTKK